jgi:hypothetical protein
MRNKIIFSHIPKTAGTSILSLLNSNYPKTRRIGCYPSTTEKHFDVITKMPFLNVIATHCQFGCHEAFGWPAQYFSFLRHPVDQVVSNFSHLQRRGFDHEMPPHMSLEQFLKSEDGNNLQTVYFSGINQTDSRFKEDPQKVLEIAKSNMERFYFFIGITERYSESAFMLSKILRWRILKIEHKNANKTRPAVISREIRQLIENKCCLDMQLYEYGKKKFDENFRSFRTEFSQMKRSLPQHVVVSNRIKNILLSRWDSIQSRYLRITSKMRQQT